MADLADVVRLRAQQDRVSTQLARGIMLQLGGRDLSTEPAPGLARLVLPGLMYARELSWAIGLDLCRALAPGGDVPEVAQPTYTSRFLVAALAGVLRAPAPTPVKVALRTVRHAEQANRETVTAVAARDRRARGWARVSGGAECGFCLVLVSRGPVYSQQGGGFRAHDRCRCSAVPVYGDDWAGREAYERASSVYSEATRGAGRGNQLAAVRAYQRQQQNSGESTG